ncbi:hypothetical protein PHMEG_00029024 [Phytophthora megakarya]|uniref:PiggyBac transposable element-derived protein domain-containing protein n=1 Tax=Phytophthora megakarya TaxID=4795 RepID=A0A225V4N7_9STRA|nr:hypothetical protein PHMEG_00029024 [Phytophthora megakarya]
MDGILGSTDRPTPHWTMSSFVFMFMLPRLLLRIESESNKYYNHHFNERTRRKYFKTLRPQRMCGCKSPKDTKKIKRRFADHWAKTVVGAVQKGTFGCFITKTRFGGVMQNLHFSDNSDALAGTYRAWKVRSVLDTLQETFRNGYKVSHVLVFDEAMIPSRSRHKVTRQFMNHKPHKWGTKLFMTCCIIQTNKKGFSTI